MSLKASLIAEIWAFKICCANYAAYGTLRCPLEYTYAVKLDLPSGPVGRLPADVDEVHAGDVVVSALDRGLRRRPRESVFGGA